MHFRYNELRFPSRDYRGFPSSFIIPNLVSVLTTIGSFRTIVALGHLVVTCDQTLYVKLIDMLLKELASNAGSNTLNTRTTIQSIGTVCKQAGHRFGDHVEKVMPLILQFATVEDDELREHCLQACENMVYKCGKEITPHVPTIVEMCLKYICYDPNYNYDEGDDDDSMECEDEVRKEII